MKTFYIMLTLLYAGLASAHTGHEDVSYLYAPSSGTLTVLLKASQSIAAACADGKRTNIKADVTKVQLVFDNKNVYVKCK